MNIEVGQIWVSTYVDNWVVRVKEFYKHNGMVEYIDDDGENSCHVTNFIDEFEFLREGAAESKEGAPKPDMVNKPPHYKDASGIECKEITCHRKMPFSLGNAIKYLYRAGSKGDLLEDLKKAEWYLRVAYLNSEPLPVEVVRRLSEVAAVRNTEAGRALNLISRHQVLDAYRVVKSEIEQLEMNE